MNHLLPIKTLMSVLLLLLISMSASAQLSKNPDKFLGNITTRYQVDAGGGVPQYYTLWNQITCENESKWICTWLYDIRRMVRIYSQCAGSWTIQV